MGLLSGVPISSLVDILPTQPLEPLWKSLPSSCFQWGFISLNDIQDMNVIWDCLVRFSSVLCSHIYGLTEGGVVTVLFSISVLLSAVRVQWPGLRHLE